MKRGSLYRVLLVGWVAFTLVLTSIPNPRFIPDVPHLDKFGHLGFYGVTGFLCALRRRESGKGRRSPVLFTVIFVALLGAVDEVHQYWIPGRSMEFFDWIADLLGGGVGALFLGVATRRFPFLLTGENPPSPRAVAY